MKKEPIYYMYIYNGKRINYHIHYYKLHRDLSGLCRVSNTYTISQITIYIEYLQYMDT